MLLLNRRVHVGRLMYAAESGSQETSALVTGELALGGTHVHTVVHPIRLSKLKGRASPATKDVLARVKKVRFSCPG